MDNLCVDAFPCFHKHFHIHVHTLLHIRALQGVAVSANGSMHGLDDIEISCDPSGASQQDEPDRLAGLAAHGNVFGTPANTRAANVQHTLQQPGGVLASTTQSTEPANDYDPAFIPLQNRPRQTHKSKSAEA